MADLLAYGEDIIGFPGGEATAKVKLMNLLWENPDPTQAMAADTEISINDANYDLLAYVCLYSPTNNRVIPAVLTPKNKDAYVCYADSANALQRRFDYTNSTITAKGGYIGSTNDNRYIILYQIYGIKLEQEIPVVAENVSTMAANCLLSDGETSVEDALTYSTTEHKVGKWIDGSDLYEKTIDFGALPNNSSKAIPHGISNLDKIVSINPIAINSSITIAYYSSSNSELNCYVQGNNVIYSTDFDGSSRYGYVTLRYTKNN